MRRTLAAILALTILLLAWTTWRVVSLSQDVDRLSGRDAPPLERSPDPTGPTSTPDVPPAPLAAPPAAEAGLARRLAALEKRLGELQARWETTEETRRDLALLVADLVDARVTANETTVLATSRQSVSSQAQFHQSRRCDVNRNGTGEYGGFFELSGLVPGRMNARLVPNVLSPRLSRPTPNGEVVRDGYVYRFFLPDAHGEGVAEPAGGFTATMVDPLLAETLWCLYAWPETYGRTGKRTFFVNQAGDVLATDSPSYSGPGAGPRADAAFAQAGSIAGLSALGTKGADGNVWTQVN